MMKSLKERSEDMKQLLKDLKKMIKQGWHKAKGIGKKKEEEIHLGYRRTMF
ncbi:hypothetical protein Scep_003200 [Stephania cephalantha]|uniref:Uncharacterized protein n=1 Tax=Stephania cephalantha TaxID=152367 RepID=A0AAP0PXT9_9MAGN